MSTWRLARSLEQLRGEVNALFPARATASDGTIGDAAHASRDSDHNPWVKDGSTGVVTAIDITEDSENGVTEIADFIVSTLVKNRDSRVKYIIHEGRMWRSYDKPGIPKWTPAPYSGPNGHFKHVHVSVKPEKTLYDSRRSWGLGLALAERRSTKVARVKAGLLAVLNSPDARSIPTRRRFTLGLLKAIRGLANRIPDDR